MKVRNGFVSNSSSSSFIVVFAKIKDEKSQQLLSKYSDLSDLWIKDGKELIEYFEKNYYINGDKISFDADWAGVYHTIPKQEIELDSKYVLFEYYGNEGDYVFMERPALGECEYNIDLDFFDDKIQSLYKGVTKENGFDKIFKSYGAGRNG